MKANAGFVNEEVALTLFSMLRYHLKNCESKPKTWVLFIDLVKAFDRVPQDMLWCILLKFGVSEKLVNTLKQLHQNFQVTFDVDSISHTITCTIGVKQGDNLGPDLFAIYIAAIMSTWINHPVYLFQTKKDFQLTGRRFNAVGISFEVEDSKYADGTAILFESRNDIISFSPLLIAHFRKFGMEIHVGDYDVPNKPSKTVCTQADEKLQ